MRQIATDAANAFIFNPTNVALARKGLKGLWASSPLAAAANDLSQVSWQSRPRLALTGAPFDAGESGF